MFSSIKLGKFFGIDLYVHGTFWLLPLLVLFSGVVSGGEPEAIAGELAFVFVIFACVVLHEVGHALAARAYGIGTRDITLYPVGGVASLDHMPEKPSREIAIALAGPAVNFVIAGALFVGLFAGSLLSPSLPTANELTSLDGLALKILAANFFLALFNLLPAFPMDGGRVLRALLATQMNRLRATEVAVNVGSIVAGGFVLAGILLPNFTLVVLAIVVLLLGQAELAVVRTRVAQGEWASAKHSYDSSPADEQLEPPMPRGFTGLVWNAQRGVWMHYQNGHLVRVIDLES